MKNIWIFAMVAALSACGQTPDKPSPVKAAVPPKTAATPVTTNEMAVIKTDRGEMVVQLWPDVAPETVKNFKKLAEEKFYDGTAFHRIVKGFMIQGGDPLSKTDDPRVGQGDPGYKIKAEFNNRPHEKGVLSMARSRDPNSAGCQFFICLDRAPHLDGQYTAFGKVIKGQEVLTQLGETPVEPNAGGEMSKPKERVGVASIRLLPPETPKK